MSLARPGEEGGNGRRVPSWAIALAALAIGLVARLEAVRGLRVRDPRLWSLGHVVLLTGSDDGISLERTLRALAATRVGFLQGEVTNAVQAGPRTDRIIELEVRPGAERIVARALRRLGRVVRLLTGSTGWLDAEPVPMIVPAGSGRSVGLLAWEDDLVTDVAGDRMGVGVRVHILDSAVFPADVPDVEFLGNYTTAAHARRAGRHDEDGIDHEPAPGPHGTVVAALARRYAPMVRLSNTQILDPNGLPVPGTALTMALYETAEAVRRAGEPTIVNLSLRVPALETSRVSTTWTADLSAIAKPLRALHALGVLVVVPTGNTTDLDASDDTLAYPARLGMTVAIGSCDRSGVRQPISRHGEKEGIDDPFHWWMMPTPALSVAGQPSIETSYAAGMASGLIASHLDDGDPRSALEQFAEVFDPQRRGNPGVGLGILRPARPSIDR